MRRGSLPIVLIGGLLLGGLAFVALRPGPSGSIESAGTTTTSRSTFTTSTAAVDASATSSVAATTTTTLPIRPVGAVPGWTVGLPWGSVPGVTMFRGNPTRSFYGTGPLPVGEPDVLWRYPDSPMCSTSSVGGESRVWCGLGWTGQPVIYERADGHTELIFGAYDRAVHFIDADTGDELRPSYVTGDLIKGSVTLDPDGYPLLYFGSRDNKLRVVALDRETPELLWSLDASEVNGIWNNDWDGNPVIVDDVLYEGGENGWLFAYELNRGYAESGLVSVSPRRLLAMPGYDDDLIARSGRNVSIESSVAIHEQRLYFTNSGGRVLGIDISKIRDGVAEVIFDYYAGGDIDATPIVDAEGNLYVSIEHEPSQMAAGERERNREVGQLVKLDPHVQGDPRVWGIDLTAGADDSGIWATPVIHEGHLYVSTHNGDLIAVDAGTGEITWSDPIGWHSWSSPVVVDGTLVVATCLGEVRAYSLDTPARPAPKWVAGLGESCLEATPVVWEGVIYLGSRDGFMRALR